MKESTLLGNLHNGLYYSLDKYQFQSTFITPNHVNKGNLATTTSCNDVTTHVKLLHLRLGHLPFAKLKMMYPSLNIKTVQEHVICTVCPAARQTRLSFTPSLIKTTSNFKLLHVDVWGPYNTPTYSGHTMFLTVVDDFSRSTWVFLLKQKSQSVHMVQHLVNYIETYFHTHVKSIRTDNAKELCEGDMLHFYHQKGI